MDAYEYMKNLLAPKPERKKTVKQLHNEIFKVNKPKKQGRTRKSKY